MKRPKRARKAAAGGWGQEASPAKLNAADADLLEVTREGLLQRLNRLDPDVKARPGYRSALRLLNQKFRLASLAARVGILQAASFMVEILERVSF